MDINVNGNFIYINIEENYFSSKWIEIKMPDGYSIKTFHIYGYDNVGFLSTNSIIHFPSVNGKNPDVLRLYLLDTSKRTTLYGYIEEFGLEPDSHYFDKEFEPILVTNEMGKEYNVIPSTQFK